MKRMICLLLALVLLLLPLGCGKNKARITLHFYYPLQNYGYDIEDGRFYSQSAREDIREDVAYYSARQVIGIYLKGPVDSALTNPFPAGTELLDLYYEGNILYLTLSDSFSALSGIPMIMASSCLAKTALTLIKASEVRIRCESELLDGNAEIVIQADSFVFDDQITTTDSQ